MEDDDAFGQGTGEARDSISNLPRKVAIQVYTCSTVSQIYYQKTLELKNIKLVSLMQKCINGALI